MNQMVEINFAPDMLVGSGPPQSKGYLRVQLTLLMALADVTALLAGFISAGVARFGGYGVTASMMLGNTIVPLYLLCAVAIGAFSGDTLVRRGASMRLAVMAFLGACSTLLLLLFLLQTGTYTSRLQFGFSVAFTLPILAVVRFLFVQFSRGRLAGGLYAIVILDDTETYTRHEQLPAINARSLFDPMNPDPVGYDRLARCIGKADQVVVRCSPERRTAWSHVLQGMNVHAEIVADDLLSSGVLGIGRFDGAPTLLVARGPLGLRDRMIKRAFDVAVSGCAFVALLPLLSVIAVAIKLDSPGPVLFRQPRIGRQNSLFDVLKFRSMRTEQCDSRGTRSTTGRDDDRITRVGRFLRRTSLDELPQLFNVLKGDMSVVGPRPHAVHSTAQNKLFWEVDQRYWYRHACRPGITGLAQIRGHRGATHREKDLRDRLAADLEYVNNWTFFQDISIIFRTFAVLIHPNAF